MKILLVEDDEGLAELLCKNLASRHYLVEVAFDGQVGLELAEAFKYDLILLDFRLPKLDGISLCRRLREHGDRTPILLLTAYDSRTERVAGLDAGADDYIVKPFDFEELLARIRALLRRGDVNASPVIEWENLCLDPSSCEVSYSGQPLHLTSKEYALIELFLRNSKRIFSQSALLDRLWSFDEPPLENTVRAHIKSLRKKLKRAGAEDLIETVYGLGYRLRVAASAVQNQETIATAASDPQTPLVSPELLSIWERHREKYGDRIAILQHAVVALAEDRLDEALRQQAMREAHTLIGSLGGFGFREAAQISREIEQRFNAGISQNQVSELQIQVAKLQGLLKQPSINVQSSALHPTVNDSLMQQSQLLVVDDDEALTAALISEAVAWGMQAEAATNLSAAREAIAHTRPDIVLLDLCFPNSTKNGLELLAELAAFQPPIPVVVLTAQEDFADRIGVARLGGQGFLQKPASPTAIMEAITQILEQSGTSEAKLLIVDDDPQMLNFLHTLLTPWGFQLTLLEDPRQFWDILRQAAPDLLILDIEMPEFSGIDLCQVVRNETDWGELPILFLSAHTDPETVHQVFEAGGDDYVSKPILGPELVARILNRLERTSTLRKLAQTDGLTGVANRRESNRELERLLRLAQRQDQPLCFMLLDLDTFKQVNEQHGHDAGDHVLRRLGEILKRNFRGDDVVARWGGEEFVIGLYGISRQEGVMRLQSVLENLRQESFRSAKETRFQVTFSAGVAQYPQDGNNLQMLYRAADEALSQAKASGRDRVLPCS